MTEERLDMTEERLVALRAEVSRHSGPARARPLVELGRELAMAYWRAGPGQPVAERFLHEAVTVLGEAHDHVEPGGAMRARTAALGGWLLGTRHVAHGGSVGDREQGIRLLDEALGTHLLEPGLVTMARVVLGQLLLSRPLERLRTTGMDPRTLMAGGSPQDAADTTRAIACFRGVADDPAAPLEAAEAARTMIGLAEMLQTLTGGLGGGPGGLGGLDLTRMMSALRTLQDLQARASGPGRGGMPNPFMMGGDAIAQMDVLDRPVPTVIEEAPSSSAPPPAAPVASTPRTPVDELRRAVLDTVPAPSVAALLETLLEADVSVLRAYVVDRLVARAEALVVAPDATDSDRVLHAAVLYRRGLVEGDGWGESGIPSPRDLRGAAAGLLTIDPTRAPAEIVVSALRLADRLTEHDPALEVATRLAERYRDIGTALSSAGVDGLLFPHPSGHRLYTGGSDRLVTVDVTQLPHRVVAVGDHPPADARTVWSVVRTAAQAVELAGRRRRAPTRAAVFVGNPRRDRDQDSVDAMLLRRTFYPGSVGLGQTVEDVSGAGTPDEVRARLDASMLHLGCGVTAAGGLELAGSSVLAVDEIAAATVADGGGLAVLPPDPLGTTPLIEALMAAGFAGAIAFRASLPTEVASLVYGLLHAELVDRRQDPAHSVDRVRRWLRDSGRVVPDYLPDWYHRVAASADVSDPLVADALVHHGL